MSDQEEERPLPRGTYNFNFEDFDENSDPFKPSKGIMNSPDKNAPNPFQSKSKLSSSPPIPTCAKSNFAEENPFQTKSKLGSSPPGGHASIPPQNAMDSETNTHDDSAKSYQTALEESPVKQQKGLKTKAKSQTPPTKLEDVTPDESLNGKVDNEEDAVKQEPAKTPPKKKVASPKKSSGIKKPKARSKFKPPANFGVQDSEDVVVFAAPPPKPEPDNDSEFPPPPEQLLNNSDSDAVVNEPIDSDSLPDVSNQMPGLEESEPEVTSQRVKSREHVPDQELDHINYMMDSVHDFGAAEMPIENNEGFVPPSEAFSEDAEAWDMHSEDQVSAGRESPCAFDPLSEDQVPSKVTQRRASDPSADDNNLDNDTPVVMSTPPQVRTPARGVARNPAARALQEQLDGDRVTKEPKVLDKGLYSPRQGDDGKGESEVERMNTANKKHAGGTGEASQDSIVQLVQEDDSVSGTQVLKYSQSDWNKMKQELELEFNARLLNKEREWSKKLADRDKKISYLDEQVLLLRSANEDMKVVVGEFEKTISQLQADKEKKTSESQQTFEDIVKERDQALEDLQSVESAFSDLHQRYERTKGVVEGFKKNEDVLKKCVQDYQGKLKAAEEKSILVRQQAEEKLAQASEEMEKLRKSTTTDVARLEAALKKTDLKIQGLERSLEQKITENEELTAICDELIAKVGGE